MKYDIISEIKESPDIHEKTIDQMNKFFQLLIYNLQKDTDLIYRMSFKKENKIILMYVLNNSYQLFIENILDFKINQKKFHEMKQYEACDSFNKNVESFKGGDGRNEFNINNLLMNLIIESHVLLFSYLFLM